MSVTHTPDLKKPSGGRKRNYKKKRKSELGSLPTHTLIGTTNKVPKRLKGGVKAIKLKKVEEANVLNKLTKIYTKAKIKTEIANNADRNLARRNVLTKGSIIDTDAGKARVTSRPGQHGQVNAVLLDDQTFGDKKKK